MPKSTSNVTPVPMGDFRRAFMLVYQAYATPADKFHSDREWAQWQHKQITQAFTHMQAVRVALMPDEAKTDDACTKQQAENTKQEQLGLMQNEMRKLQDRAFVLHMLLEDDDKRRFALAEEVDRLRGQPRGTYDPA